MTFIRYRKSQLCESRATVTITLAFDYSQSSTLLAKNAIRMCLVNLIYTMLISLSIHYVLLHGSERKRKSRICKKHLPNPWQIDDQTNLSSELLPYRMSFLGEFYHKNCFIFSTARVHRHGTEINLNSFRRIRMDVVALAHSLMKNQPESEKKNALTNKWKHNAFLAPELKRIGCAGVHCLCAPIIKYDAKGKIYVHIIRASGQKKHITKVTNGMRKRMKNWRVIRAAAVDANAVKSKDKNHFGSVIRVHRLHASVEGEDNGYVKLYKHARAI